MKPKVDLSFWAQLLGCAALAICAVSPVRCKWPGPFSYASQETAGCSEDVGWNFVGTPPKKINHVLPRAVSGFPMFLLLVSIITFWHRLK